MLGGTRGGELGASLARACLARPACVGGGGAGWDWDAAGGGMYSADVTADTTLSAGFELDGRPLSLF